MAGPAYLVSIHTRHRLVKVVFRSPPDVETLIAWEAEGGCEAACPHGNPSWLLRLGLI